MYYKPPCVLFDFFSTSLSSPSKLFVKSSFPVVYQEPCCLVPSLEKALTGTPALFFSWQIRVWSTSHWLSLFGPPKSWWKEEGWLQSVYTGSPLAAVTAVLLVKLKMKLDMEQRNNTRILQLRLLMFTLHSKTPAESTKSPHTSVIFINSYDYYDITLYVPV